LIEDVLQEVIKGIKSIKSTSGKISIKTKTVGKSMPMYRGWDESL